MKKFSLIQVPFLSFYSKKLYRDAAFNWKGIGLGYLFLLVTLCLIPKLFMIQTKIAAIAKNELSAIAAQMPDIIFTEGAASTQVKQPYIIKDMKTGKPFFVIDTTGAITDLDKTDGALFLLTKNTFITKTNTYNLEKVKQYTLNQTIISKFNDALMNYAIPVLSPFILIGTFVISLVKILIYGLVGMLFASIHKATLTYDELLRLSVAAITPAMIISAVMQTSSLSELTRLETIAITLIYLFAGVKFCADAKPVTEPIPPS